MTMPVLFRGNLFDEFFDFPFEREFFGRRHQSLAKHAAGVMKTDIRESENSFEMDIDLPGFKKEEINAKLEQGYLTISAAKEEKDEQQDENGAYIRRERYCGACSRSFYIGEDIREEEIKAKFEDGILKLTLPKRQAQTQLETKKYIAIEG